LLVRVSPYDISLALAAPVDAGQSSGPGSTDAAACFSCAHGLALAVRIPHSCPSLSKLQNRAWTFAKVDRCFVIFP
jgi:hypothetical protein